MSPAAVTAHLARFLPHLRGASVRTSGADLGAGLAVAALAVPQGLAYALVAGLPAEMGLLAAAVPTAVAAVLGSSPYLVTGPTNPVALLVGVSIVAPAVAVGAEVPIDRVLFTGIVAGLLVAGFGLVGVGRASRFMSDSVVAGFGTGVGLLIVLRLLPEVGPAPASLAPEQAFVPKVWPLLVQCGHALRAADPRALVLAALVPAGVVGLRRWDARIPGALIALALATLGAALLGWTDGPAPLRLLDTVPAELPSFVAPGFFPLDEVAAPALAVALMITMQSIAAARAVAPPPGVRLDPDRELFGQGAANVAGAFFGAMPSSGSLTRTALARSAGGRSRLAPLASGLAIAGLLPLLAPALARVPLAALVGLVVLSGLDLVNPRALRRAATTRGDALILVGTLVATLWIDLLQALYAGLFLSLLLLVRRAGRLQLVELVRAGVHQFREIGLDDQTGETPAVLLHLEGDLNFAVAPELADRLREVGSHAPRVIVLRLKRARHLDATVLETLRQAVVDLQRAGVSVVLCGLTDDLGRLLEGTELAALLGEDGLLSSGSRLFEGFERALARARELVPGRSDDEIFRTEG